MINCQPEIAELAVDLQEDLIQMATPLGEAAHVRYPLLRDHRRENRARPANQRLGSQQMSADVDVVIVGAGAAGIAAARRLKTSRLSAIVLEATARVGGRAWTCDVAGLPLDLGCGWLHSADRNPWTGIAEAAGFAVDRRTPAWGKQYCDLGFSQEEQAAARRAFAALQQRMTTAPPASDCAADVLEPEGEWNDYLHAMSGFINGAGLEQNLGRRLYRL